MGRRHVVNTGSGTVAPPKQGNNIGRGLSATVRAANDNRPGRRKVILLNFGVVPVGLDEIAVIDRLMQELPLAANDNTQVP